MNKYLKKLRASVARACVGSLWSGGKSAGKDVKPYPHTVPYRICETVRRRRPLPDSIGRIYVPLSVMRETNEVMRRFGRERRECYVWWGGYFANGDGQVVSAIWPEVRTDFGRIHLTNQQLRVLNGRLRQLDQILLVELHTHPPGAGGQNEVDAANPAATYPGFVSIVVPDFAFPNFWDLRDTYVYEYIQGNNWRTLLREDIEEKFVIEPQGIGLEV